MSGGSLRTTDLMVFGGRLINTEPNDAWGFTFEFVGEPGWINAFDTSTAFIAQRLLELVNHKVNAFFSVDVEQCLRFFLKLQRADLRADNSGVQALRDRQP